MSDLSLGAWLNLDSVLAAEAVVRAGHDWAAVDLQHGETQATGLVPMLAAVAGCGVPAWVRTQARDYAQASWALDMGADVVVIPQVSSAAQGAEALAFCRYAPDGHRSWGPTRAGLRAASAPAQQVYLMIEDAAGVAAADEICALPGLDGILIGPADLTVSLGGRVPDDLRSEGTLAAAATVVEACRRHDVAVAAFGGTPDMVPAWTGIGVTTIALVTDLGLLTQGAADALARTRG
ncbi:aldolase/citrate lyase family protein [Nocardioides lentus]|uniref:Aldolase/citrate lyase family protein n=1 Tax=Nocardioides lentus TaxID=338077 RepID=A0ABP5A742_9ACTN